MVFMSLKNLFKTCLILFAGVAVGAIAMITAYALPSDVMFDNVKNSISLYEKEGLVHYWTGDRNKYSSRLDNFTDALMLRTAIFPGSNSVINDAMLNPRFEYKNSNQVQSLVRQLKGQKNNRNITLYGRYWHGYLVILKPLTLFADVSYMRLLNLLIQVLLTSYLISLIVKQLGTGFGLSYLLSYLVLNPISLAMCFQFSTIFYVTTLISILLLKRWSLFNVVTNFLYLLLVSGIITAFFDLLTYPLLTLCIPLILFLVKKSFENKLCEKFKTKVLILYSCLFWGFGYGGMYIGKWLLAGALTGQNVLLNAVSQLQYRMSIHVTTGTNTAMINPLTTIVRNVRVLMDEPIFIVLVIILLIALFNLNNLQTKKELKTISSCGIKESLLVIMLLPFVWYIVFCNHSFVHFWFTFRELVITVFAAGSLITIFFAELEN